MVAAVGCAGLRPLPAPAVAPCAGDTAAALWSCLDRTDRDVGTDVRAAQPRETAYRSTARVVEGDLRRKLRDQRRASACDGTPPPGFIAVDEQPTEEGRAPLRAYFHEPAAGRPTVIVVHGLYDSKQSRYVRVAAAYLASRGYGVLAPDMRFHGCLLASHLPSLGPEETADLLAWGRWLRARAPRSDVGLLGFSLGTVYVIQALAADADADGAVFRAGGVAVSPAADLPGTIQRLDDPPSLADRGLQSLLVRFFQHALRTRMRELGIPTRAAGERSFARFLDWLSHQTTVSPPGTTVESLIARADVLPALAHVRRPLLLITSRRDPIYAEGGLVALRRAANNPMVHLVETTDGGHIGVLGTYPRWTAAVLERFFAESAAATVGP